MKTKMQNKCTSYFYKNSGYITTTNPAKQLQASMCKKAQLIQCKHIENIMKINKTVDTAD